MISNNEKTASSLNLPKLSEGQLESLFRRLNLANTRHIYQDVADRAEKENWTYRDFLAVLLADEVAHRKQTRLQRFTRKAHFPFFKTVSLTSVCKPVCVSPCSLPTWAPISSPRDDR
jgi:hypothetical protein